MKNILLFRLGGLGDLLVAFPAINLFRKALSPCSIALVCREEYGVILKETGVVDTLFSESDPRITPLFNPLPYSEDMASWLTSFSHISGWLQKQGSLTVEEFCAVQSRMRCRFAVFNPESKSPISFRFFKKTVDFLLKEGLRLPTLEECSLLSFSSQQKKDGLGLIGIETLVAAEKIAIVHPGSGSHKKCWPFENFLEIIHRLARNGYRGALVTGPAEGGLDEKIRSSQLPDTWRWLLNPPLLKLAGLLSISSLYLGNDSGITHLAAACGTEVVALYMAEYEAQWKPYGNATVISGYTMDDIDIDSVWKAVRDDED